MKMPEYPVSGSSILRWAQAMQGYVKAITPQGYGVSTTPGGTVFPARPRIGYEGPFRLYDDRANKRLYCGQGFVYAGHTASMDYPDDLNNPAHAYASYAAADGDYWVLLAVSVNTADGTFDSDNEPYLAITALDLGDVTQAYNDAFRILGRVTIASGVLTTIVQRWRWLDIYLNVESATYDGTFRVSHEFETARIPPGS